MMAFLVRTVIVGAAFLSAGCLTLDPPEKFLVIEKDRHSVKAVSADDARLWIREFKDSVRGDLAFWSETLENDLVGGRGYTLIEKQAVEDARSRKGTELLCEVTVQGVAHRYLITLFVIEGIFRNTIRVAEYAAPKKIFDASLDDVRESVRGIRP